MTESYEGPWSSVPSARREAGPGPARAVGAERGGAQPQPGRAPTRSSAQPRAPPRTSRGQPQARLPGTAPLPQTGLAPTPVPPPRGQPAGTAARTHLRLPLAPTEASVPGVESGVAAVTPLAALGRGRLVITHSGVPEELLSVLRSALGSAGDL